jgi:hypothetical protein
VVICWPRLLYSLGTLLLKAEQVFAANVSRSLTTLAVMLALFIVFKKGEIKVVVS